MFRNFTFATLFAAAVIGAPHFSHAADAPEGEQKKVPAAKPGDMHAEMEAMNKAIRTLNKTIADKDKLEANLAAVNDLQLHSIACKGMIPKTAESQPADKKAAFIAEYRKQMNDVIKAEMQLEDQLVAGDNAKAADTVKQLRDLEKTGHKQFQPPEKDQ